MKRIVIAYTLILIAAVLSGCGKDAASPQPSVTLSSSYEGASMSGNTLSVNVPSAGCALEISVDCNWSWDYDIQSGSWYAVEASDNRLLVSVPENGLHDRRDGIIAVRSSNETGIAEAYVKLSQEKADDPELSVGLQGEDTEIILPPDGGSYSVRVISNTDWSVKNDGGWFQVTRNDGGFEIKSESNMSFSIRASELVVVAGEGESEKSVTVSVSQLPSVEAMVFELTTDKSSSRMGVLPFGEDGTVNCIVDWGDGRLQKIGSPWPQHFYYDDGVYEVKVYGTVTCIDSDPEKFPEKFSKCITAIKSWGNVGLENISEGFAGCNGLKSVAAPGELTFANVRSVDGLFRNCSSLSEIPEGLFRNAASLTSARSVFSGCTSLESVPEDLFAGCAAAEDFYGLFEGCKSLSEVPAGIFDDCKNIRNISRAFFGCSSLKGESPYTTADGKKIHLYERDGSNSLSAIQEFAACFGECTGLDDYAAISAEYPEWK